MSPQDLPDRMRQLRSLISGDGQLRLWLEAVEMPRPAAHEVLVRVEAAPINPSDLGVLLGSADLDRAEAGGSPQDPTVVAPIPERTLPAFATRLDQSLPVGTEGAGVVVATGDSAPAQALLGRTVGFVGGGSYAEYAVVPAQLALPVPDGTDPLLAAASYVNPMTALGMVETMRAEGHTALLHTAAASSLGQMLVRICRDDAVPLVNVVRRAEQVDLLKAQGAVHALDSAGPSFRSDLVDALAATGATIAFDAIGGGRMANDVLAGMEAAIGRSSTGGYQRYGSSVLKQVYLYGSLDMTPTPLNRSYGMAWSVGGWLLTNFLARQPFEVAARMRARVADELTTTFGTTFGGEVSLAGALDLDALRTYAARSTGGKYVVRPQR